MIKPPRLQVFANCVNLIRTLPALPYDNVRVEDVDTHAEDHGYDALRYGLGVERKSSRAGEQATEIVIEHSPLLSSQYPRGSMRERYLGRGQQQYQGPARGG